MKVSLEWVLELMTAAVLFGIIFVGVHTGTIRSDMYITETQDEIAEQEMSEEQEEGAAEEIENLPLEKEHQIEDFEIVYQMPELPTGCEITAMTMVLNYYGFDVDKVVMSEEYLPTAPAEYFYDSDGELHGTDLNRYFVGDPATEEGYICGTKAIKTAANRYLRKKGSSLRAVDKTGASAEEMYRLVSGDIPVVVWVTINMEERQIVEGWKTEFGEYVEWGNNDHGAVLIGYTENTVTIADPITGEVEYSREAFEEVYVSRGNQCVILSNEKI